MSKLESLLSISRLQTEQQLAALQQKRRSIAYLAQQLSELMDYSGYYQEDPADSIDNLAALFTHRQTFVTQLHKQIGELSDRIETLNIDADNCAAQWRVFEAKQNAIASMYDQKCVQDAYKQEALARGDMDELARLICMQSPHLDHD
ncbi:MAG: hypothetical protein KTR35_08125 [Gammaproteobacteria bacterium]|nr:hypothetical protein [Gammaproteobacteria bacterium]